MNLKTSETMRSPATAESAVTVLLRGLIDYAGLFPPALLAMAPAVANYRAYLRSEYGFGFWALCSHGCATRRVRESSHRSARSNPSYWPNQRLPARKQVGSYRFCQVRTSLPMSRGFTNSTVQSRGLASSYRGAEIKVHRNENKKPNPEGIHSLAKMIPAELETYFEIPLTTNESDCIAAVASCGRRAKIRTGGETADKFPAPERVIEFIQLCAAANVPFKATAGLHHPLRSIHHFTNQPDSLSGVMHGFLNVFLASAFFCEPGVETWTCSAVVERAVAACFPL